MSDADADTLLRALGAEQRAQEAELADAWPSADPTLRPFEAQEAARLFDAARRRPRRRAWWGGGLAAAAVILFFVWPRSAPPPDLPAYRLHGTGDATTRSEPAAGLARYTPGSRVLLIATPAAPAGAVEARIYVEQGGERTAATPRVEVSAEGAIRLDGEVGRDLALTPGPGEIVILVRPIGLPDSDAELLDRANPAPALRLRHPFVFSAGP